MKKHILVISQYFYPEQFRINDIAAEWVKRGYEVTVITGIPNYPQGKFFEGFGILKRKKESYKGINIVRLPLVPRGNNSIMLALNYLSFVISGFFWCISTKIKADFVFIFEVSPMTQALPGVWYSKRRKIPCYLYVQDLWPENVEIVTGISNKRLISTIGKIVDYIYFRSTKIFVTSKSFIEAINKRGVPSDKIEYWPQYAEDFYKPMDKITIPEIPNDEAFNIIFAGNIGVAQGLEILPKTAKVIKNTDIKVRFNIVGDGRYKSDLITLVNESGVSDMFNFIPQQPAIRIPEYMAANDAAFICLTDRPLFSMTIPAKLQSYMACGIPIIASAEGESNRIINESNAGICGPSGDYEKLSENINILTKMSEAELEQIGCNAKKYYDSNFSKEELLNRMDKYFEFD